MVSLDSLLLDASSFIQSEFRLESQQSQLKPYSPENWQEFCQVNGFDVTSEGLYIPTSYSAYVKTDSPVLVSNVFHEYFGHGLFCEHSQIGKKLVDIVQNGADDKSFLYEDVNPQEQPLGLCKQNIGNYEGFAVWLEALLCEATDNERIWQMKKDRLPKDYRSLFEFFQDIELKLSRFGLMAQLAFPKFYNDDKILEVVRRLYSTTFGDTDFIIIYGSQEPESDIDLFVVSTNPSQNYFNGWLDIYELNREEFNLALAHLDISITDPLFSGRLIYGNKNGFKRLKQQLLNQQITQEAIAYNLAKAEEQRQYLPQFKSQKQKEDCLSYIESFSQNAEQLQRGNKPLTLVDLQQTYRR